jgi:acetate kinase
MRILVVNTGSSSLKLRLLGQADAGWSTGPSRHVADWDGEDVSPIADLLAEAGTVDAVGHRVVHGGVDLREPTLLDDEVVKRVDALTPLAPLHQQRALAGVAAARQVLPDVPHVACFDTAYHATIPEAAATYALPAEWRQRWPLRRFGFHGLSHAYAARRAVELVVRTAPMGPARLAEPADLAGSATPGHVDDTRSAHTPERHSNQTDDARLAHAPERRSDDDLRVVTCHLGAGASLCASRGGRSVDTTMGFTPLEGLVMGTRAGSVDPGLVLWLITEAGLTPDEVSDGLEHQSGLQGLAGTSDMADVLARARAGDPASTLARDVYIHVLTREIAAMTASLGGLDVLVFTGGVGEHAPEVRTAAATRLAYLGIVLDVIANATATTDTDVTASDAPVTTLVVTAREDLEIAQQVRSLLK